MLRGAGVGKWPKAKYRGTNNLDTQVLAFGLIPTLFPFHMLPAEFTLSCSKSLKKQLLPGSLVLRLKVEQEI